MPETIHINMTEMAVGKNNTKIETNSIGSCVVIVIQDHNAHIGGMAHAALPSVSDGNSDVVTDARKNINANTTVAKYADEAVDRLIDELIKLGADKSKLEAKLVGGARMFKILSGDKHGVGYRNVEAARNRLQVLGIPIKGEDTGGTVGRTADLDMATGLLNVNTKM